MLRISKQDAFSNFHATTVSVDLNTGYVNTTEIYLKFFLRIFFLPLRFLPLRYWVPLRCWIGDENNLLKILASTTVIYIDSCTVQADFFILPRQSRFQYRVLHTFQYLLLNHDQCTVIDIFFEFKQTLCFVSSQSLLLPYHQITTNDH